MSQLTAYLPADRHLSLARGILLPDRAYGTVLFVDVSGFTPLTERLVQRFGPERAAEELTHTLNHLYALLIEEVHLQQGSVIGFAGDAMTCWFDGDQGHRAVTVAWQMQAAIAHMPSGDVPLHLKISVVSGAVRRFLLGDPSIQHLDTLAGHTLRRMAAADKVAQQGEVLLSTEIVHQLSSTITLHGWREASEQGEAFAVLASLLAPAPPTPWPALPALPDEQVRAWLLGAVYDRLREGQGDFLADLRPAVALFLHFSGIDYDGDDLAGTTLDAFIRWVQGCVTRQGGALLDLTIGDKGSYLYVVFGAPLSRSDASSRAVATALELQHAPTHFPFLVPLQMGIAQGQMRAGSYGGPRRRTYGVLGDKVNLAARLMQAAPPGGIWCDHETVLGASRHWHFEPLPPVQLKGKREPVRVYRPTGQAVRSQPGRPSTATPALIGRAAEQAHLAALLDALSLGQHQSLVIEGEAGIGKSCLVGALLAQLEARELSALVGAGQSIEQQTPYRAWHDLLMSYFALGLESKLSERQARVQAVVEQMAPEHGPRLCLLNELLHLGFAESALTVTLSPELRQQNLFLLVHALLRARAREGPLVLVLEDAHWLDPLSWELTVQVARALAASSASFLLVLVTRPLAEHERVAASLRVLREVLRGEVMTLTSLEPEAMDALVAARLGLARDALPAPLLSLIRERAGGNPFFAVELLHGLQEQGWLTIYEEEARGNGPTHRIAQVDSQMAHPRLPDTLQGLILARLDRLSPERQLTLKVAAVIGRLFALSALQALLGRQQTVTKEPLMHQLEETSRREFTQLEAWQSELVYAFKHLLTQEAIYQTLLFSQRRELHQGLAGWYESTLVPLAPYYPLLVYHYRQAELPAQERRYAELAAGEAARQFANQEAISYLSRALALTPDDAPVDRFRLLCTREALYDRCGDRAGQAQDLALLARLAEQHQAVAWQGEVALRQVNHLIGQSDFTQALPRAEQAARDAEARGDLLGQAAALLQAGTAAWRLGHHALAEANLETALPLAEQGRDAHLVGRIWRSLGTTYFLMQQPDQARHCYERALSLCRATGDLEREGAAHSDLGNTFSTAGHYSQAAAYYEEALRLNRLVGHRAGEATVLYNLAELSYRLGEYGRAESLAGQAAEIFAAIGDQLGAHCEVPALLGSIAYETWDAAQAEAWSLAAIQASRALETPFSLAIALLTLGRTYARAGRWAEAEALLSEARDVSESIQDTAALWEVRTALVLLWMRLDDAPRARSAAEESWTALRGNLIPEQVIPLVCLGCLEVWQPHGDARVPDLLALGDLALQNQAARIGDEAQRHSFLENVGPHRALRQCLERTRASQSKPTL